jgi:hypothetical protein
LAQAQWTGAVWEEGSGTKEGKVLGGRHAALALVGGETAEAATIDRRKAAITGDVHPNIRR